MSILPGHGAREPWPAYQPDPQPPEWDVPCPRCLAKVATTCNDFEGVPIPSHVERGWAFLAALVTWEIR